MQKWSLNAKIILIIAVLIVGGGVVSYAGLSKMSEIKSITDEITTVLVKRDQLTSEVQDQQRRVTIFNKDLVIEKSPERMQVITQDITSAREALFKALTEYEAISSAEGLVLSKKYREQLEAWNEINRKIRELSRQGLDEQASEMTRTQEVPARDASRETLIQMNALTAKRLADATIEADTAYETAKMVVFAVCISALVLGLSLAAFVLRAVNKAIDKVIDNLRDNTLQVTAAAGQIAASSEELSHAATEQAASLQETAAAIDEMNSMIQRNSDNSRRTADFAETSQSSALKGKQVVQRMIEAIGDINDSNTKIMEQVKEGNNQISEIVKVIAEIGSKTKVINDIVFQTKLLSFNASVEAARAGEHGKGFAVVAEEVGNLAQMSGNAAKEISSLLEGSIQRVEGIVSGTTTRVDGFVAEGRTKVETGTRIAEECGEVLETIVGNVGSVTQMSQEISSASVEQARGAAEITKAMSQLDEVTQANSASSEEAASAAEELSAQADVLRGVVQTLISTIKGERATQQDSGNFAKPEPTAVSRPEAANKKAQVIPMRAKKAPNAHQPSIENVPGPAKMAVGANTAPSADDPRFQDV